MRAIMYVRSAIEAVGKLSKHAYENETADAFVVVPDDVGKFAAADDDDGYVGLPEPTPP